MTGSTAVYYDDVLNQEIFPNDFFNNDTEMSIGANAEWNANNEIYSKYVRTMCSLNRELKITNPENSKNKFISLYPTQKYICNTAPHIMPSDAVAIFGTKIPQGHAITFCSNCLFKHVIALLKYYETGEFYQYTKNDYIRLEKITEQKNTECYLCSDTKSKHFKISIYRHFFILCEKDFDSYIELVLTSPAVKTLYPKLAKRYITAKDNKNAKNNIKKQEKKTETKKKKNEKKSEKKKKPAIKSEETKMNEKMIEDDLSIIEGYFEDDIKIEPDEELLKYIEDILTIEKESAKITETNNNKENKN